MENIPAQDYKPPKNWKPLVFILVGTLTVMGLGLGGFYYRSQINKTSAPQNIKPKATPKLIEKGKVTDLTKKDFPNLFYADLEYDPQTGLVKQIKTDTVRGDFQGLLPEKPKGNLTDKFIYEVEVISQKKEIILSGWRYDYKEIIQDASGKLQFRVTISYSSGSTVKVLLDGKPIWIGVMPEQ